MRVDQCVCVLGSLHERIGIFIERADAFVVLPGNIGTFTELVLAWNTSCVKPFAKQARLNIYAWRDPWEQVVQVLNRCPALSLVTADMLTENCFHR